MSSDEITPQVTTKEEWKLIDAILDDLQTLCRKHNIGLIHDSHSVKVCENHESQKQVFQFLYITPGRMRYTK